MITQGVMRRPMVAPLSADGLRAIQTKAQNDSNGSIQALNNGSVGGDAAGAGLAALGTGAGTGGGPTGGSDGNASAGGGQTVALYSGNDGAFTRKRAPEEVPISPLTFALAAAFLTLLALTWAYIRRNA